MRTAAAALIAETVAIAAETVVIAGPIGPEAINVRSNKPRRLHKRRNRHRLRRTAIAAEIAVIGTADEIVAATIAPIAAVARAVTSAN